MRVFFIQPPLVDLFDDGGLFLGGAVDLRAHPPGAVVAVSVWIAQLAKIPHGRAERAC